MREIRKIQKELSSDLGTKNQAASENDEFPKLDERLTQELVIAMVGPIGSGATTVAKIIESKLKSDYDYEVKYIRVSEIINARAPSLNSEIIDPNDPRRVEKLQDLGNRLREKHSPDVLSIFSIDEINKTRNGDKNGNDRRFCTIIDSLKNPEEAILLRKVYGDIFWTVGVFAPEEKRISRLQIDFPSSSYLHKIRDADYDEGSESGQSVRKTMNFADMFLRNDGDNSDRLTTAVERFLKLIFGIGVQTPTKDEYSMQAAAGVALNSACLSRQVGAVIISSEGELIGKGANDVPRFGGGTYTADDGANDHRCHKWKSCQCWNDHHKERLYGQVASELRDHLDGAMVRQALRKTDAKNLIEFSRAVHAEMEAIISVARQGHKGMVGSKLYTTTFPCHSCARHIVAAGIKTVVYIEPYPKSLALTLHEDAITTKADEAGKVAFLQYEGVSPSSFSRVFGVKNDRKALGKVITLECKTARPLAAPPIDSLVSREEMVLMPVLEKEGI